MAVVLSLVVLSLGKTNELDIRTIYQAKTEISPKTTQGLQSGGKMVTEVKKTPHAIADPFVLWSRRDEVSNETVSAVLNKIAKEDSCYKSSVAIPMNSLEQVAWAINKKYSNGQPNQKLVFAVLGDSVSADRGGYVDALQSFLTLSPVLSFPVEVRNYAVGGTGPRFVYFCNELRGDEDIVMFENVRGLGLEAEAVVDLASSLVIRGYGVILAHWHSQRTWDSNPDLNGFEKASRELKLPLLNLAASREQITQCLPANANLSIPEEHQIYRDEVHPNRLGELIFATLVGRVFEEAVGMYNDNNLDWKKLAKNHLSS
eukprot:scaffold187687_cov24-Attheya_sp.AAC.1